MKKLLKWNVLLLFLLSTKPNASTGTINLIWSPSHSVATGLYVHEVRMLEILFWYWPETLKSTEGWKMHKPQWDQPHWSDLEETVSCYLVWYPSRSLRRTKQDLTILQRLIQDKLQNRLHVFPFQIKAVQKIEENIFIAKTEFAIWFLQII